MHSDHQSVEARYSLGLNDEHFNFPAGGQFEIRCELYCTVPGTVESE